MLNLYPEIKPYARHELAVEAPHVLYVDESGSPDGLPVLFIHGGPGSGCDRLSRRFFDPNLYRIVTFDQRGCGRSTPHAELEANTTWHLVADIERLRELCGFEKWLVFGGSWGSTLALAYAETHPDRVSELVLRGIYTVTRPELDWYYQFGVSEIYPDQWEKFIAPIPESERGEMMQAYNRYLTGTDETKKLECAKAWSQWEGATIALVTDPDRVEDFGEDKYAIAFARIENHFFVNGGWLEEGQLLRDAGKLRNIPGVIVHGRYDMPCPLKYAWQLAKAWPDADFHIIEAAGHAMSEPGILDQLIRANDRFAGK